MKTNSIERRKKFYLRQRNDARKMRVIYRKRRRFVKNLLYAICYGSMITLFISFIMAAITVDRLYEGSLNSNVFFVILGISLMVMMLSFYANDKLKKLTTR